MKYYIIAGEVSGDMHAANLIAEIKKRDSRAEFRVWGGDRMQAQGVTLVKHLRHMAFMGFVEVVAHLRTVLGNIGECKRDIAAFRPDAVILVDYPGFNLRIAKFAHDHGFRVLYYISPQVWAWKRGRVRKIRKSVDKMLVILPFEEEFYRHYGVDVSYVGHPLLDEMAKAPTVNRQAFMRRNGLGLQREIIALLPGSRRQEVRRMLEVMLKVVPHFPDYQFVVAAVPSVGMDLYRSLAGTVDVVLVEDQTQALLQNASAALVTSGTATLETALLNVPEVVCYKTSPLSYRIARCLVRVKFISLVNLVMGRRVVTELIQSDLTEANLVAQLRRLLDDSKVQRALLNDYMELQSRLGNSGASEKSAELIVKLVKS